MRTTGSTVTTTTPRAVELVRRLVADPAVALTRASTTANAMNLAAACIMGGALGNVIDRFAYGHVIDFIQVYYANHYWPAFNLADSAICFGAACMVWDSFQQSRRAAH
mgnify:CR=1 FL=1